jgi:hypothetical protein
MMNDLTAKLYKVIGVWYVVQVELHGKVSYTRVVFGMIKSERVESCSVTISIASADTANLYWL